MSEENASENTILYIRQGDQKDGYAEVVIDSEGHYATAAFFPPVSGGAFLAYPTVIAKLEDAGINSGILHDAIQDAILKANSSHSSIKNITIAAWVTSVDEVPEHFIIRKDLLDRKPEIDAEATRIDWHTISAFSIVQQKEPIARRMPKIEGKRGVSIRGEEIPFKVKPMPPYSAGANVIDHEKGLFAGKNGRLSIDSRGSISIEEVLVLKDGVNFTTGNITFPGDIILKGKIGDGFKIYAGGTIVSSEVVDVTEIVCKKDLLVQAGIEGRARGALRIGGKLSAKYIQNCRAAVRGDITVTGSIIQSKIYSMGTIRMGESGKLVGCECIVIGGVQAYEIGSKRGSKTWIRCGTDFTVQQELDIANEQMKILALKIQRAEVAHAEGPSPELERYIEEMKKKKTEVASRIPLYLPKIDTNDSAYVEVRGTVYPGTEIEICHVPYSVTKEQKQVVFKLDKARGVIITEPWKKKGS